MELNLNNRTNTNMAQAGKTKTKTATAPQQRERVVYERTFGMDFTETVNIVFAGILLACLLTAVVVYIFGADTTSHAASSNTTSASTGKAFSSKVQKKLYATRDTLAASPTIDGIIIKLLDNYVLGYNSDNTLQDASAEGVIDQSVDDDGTITTTNEPDAGSSVVSTGASMILDGGQGLSGYDAATSHAELVTQLESALAANDYAFVGMKLAYKDDYGDLTGYPQSVVSYFTEYMSTNADKRSEFIAKIKDESFSATNDSAYIVVLPVIRFTVNMAYDETTVSVPGFGDQVVNAGQSAVIKPLLPCMYSVTLSNAQWSAPVTKEIETNLDELSYSLSVS